MTEKIADTRIINVLVDDEILEVAVFFEEETRGVVFAPAQISPGGATVFPVLLNTSILHNIYVEETTKFFEGEQPLQRALKLNDGVVEIEIGAYLVCAEDESVNVQVRGISLPTFYPKGYWTLILINSSEEEIAKVMQQEAEEIANHWKRNFDIKVKMK